MRPSSHPAYEVWEWLLSPPQLIRIIARLFLYHWYFNTFLLQAGSEYILAIFFSCPSWPFLLFPYLVTSSMSFTYGWKLAEGLMLALQGQDVRYALPNRMW